MHDPFDDTLMPFDVDAFDAAAPQRKALVLSAPTFAYIGWALTLAQFQGYVQSFDFGKLPLDYVVLHHTANPDASWAPLSSNPATKWDRSEAGLTNDLIRAKRLRQLNGIMQYYRDTLGWDCGPHLFIDDKWIYLFTPMSRVGIHAKWGNSFRAIGRIHFSLGIEVIGYYGRSPWPAAVAANVRGAVLAVQARVQTFQLRYLYPTPESKPGMVGTGDKQACAHPDRLRFGGISSHRDYNKPECPGAAITEDFYMSVIAPPPVFPRLYKANKQAIIFERSDGQGPLFPGTLNIGELVQINMTYPQGTGHLLDGRGFVRLADLDEVK